MYTYKMVRIPAKGFVITEVEDHDEVIDRHANEGWRLVQILPVKYATSGVPMEFEVIFERKKEN